MKKNDEIILDIIDITSEGSGVAKQDGMAVFVPMTAIGDTVKARILKVKKNYAFAKVIEIINPSKTRINVDCSIFSKCGGCAFRHIDYEEEKRIKENNVYEVIKRIGLVDKKAEEMLFDEPDFYRNKVQYPISIDGEIGFFALHSHRIVPCKNCYLQPQIFTSILEAASNWIEKYNISIYNEETNKGLLRHIYIRKGEISGEIMVVLVINGDSLPMWEELLKAISKVCGESLKSFQININKAKTNVILGEKCKTLFGNDYITDVLCGVKVRLSALSFYQVNHKMAEKLYQRARDYVNPKGKTILDLYCGAGTIGLSMANEAEKIIGVEIVEEAIKDANFNAEQNGIKNAEFICADAAVAAKMLAEKGIKTDAVIVDPPRKGCSYDLIETIAQKFSPKRVVYVSCDPATLARDIKLFGDLGYKLEKYSVADLFPRTQHCECCALLLKESNLHEMNLHAEPFSLIKTGAKTIELRLFDEKRSKIKVGDSIVFKNTESGETLTKKVIALHKFENFAKLYKNLPLLKCGYTEENIAKADPEDMTEYYSQSEQKKYGVLGIELSEI